MSDRLVDKYMAKGLMQKEYDRVKLHATVMNTIFRKDPTGTTDLRNDGRSFRDRESFDANNVLKVDITVKTVLSGHSKIYNKGLKAMW